MCIIAMFPAQTCMPYLTAGLEYNTTLQQLFAPIPLSINHSEHTTIIFSQQFLAKKN